MKADNFILLDSSEAKDDADQMEEYMRKNKHRLLENLGGTPLRSLPWNKNSSKINNTTKMPSSWLDQAAQNPWGSSTSTQNTSWIVKTDHASTSVTSKKDDNPFQGPAVPHKTFGQPKLTLGNWFYKRYQILLPNDCFECRDNGDAPHLLKWTCIFTCPLTTNRFASGQYVGADDTRFSISRDEDDRVVVWFHTKKEAEHAAAARALDCLNFMEQQLSEGHRCIEYHNYCLEEPTIPSIPYPPPTHGKNGSNNNKEEKLSAHDSTSTTMAEMEQELNDLQITISNNKQLGSPPKQRLVQWYTSRYKLTLRNDAFTCHNDRNPSQQLLKWTCTFTCPLTKNSFKSGTVQIKKNNKTEEEDTMKDDDDVWFSTKKEAEHAAAARALDCLIFMTKNLVNKNDSSDAVNEYQYYCKEKPTIPPIPYPPCRTAKMQDAASCTSIMETDLGESREDYRMVRNTA